MKPDLYALIIRLTAADSGTLPATAGRLAHAAFFNILEQADPVLAEALHDMEGRKPFTISPLRGFRRKGKSRLEVPAGRAGWLRVTLLDPVLFQSFIGHFLAGPVTATIRLGDLDFQVTEILSNGESHFLAGTANLAGLRERWEEAPVTRASRKVALNFGSPTVFSIRNPDTPFRLMQVLPVPAVFFREVARYWDDLTGDETREAVEAYAEDAVAVARHKIHTRMFRYRHNRLQVGFSGKVTYEILDKENASMIRHLNRLADLAFFTGVGSKTTMGMGQVYRRKKEGE